MLLVERQICCSRGHATLSRQPKATSILPTLASHSKTERTRDQVSQYTQDVHKALGSHGSKRCCYMMRVQSGCYMVIILV